MNFKRIISTVLAFVMALGFLTVFPMEVAAAEVVTAQSAGKVDEEGDPIIDYTNSDFGFKNRQEKLDTMMEVKTVGDITLYYEAFTGEVAIKNNKTGDVMFTNPYDISDDFTEASESTKEMLLSQIILTYKSTTSDEIETFYSFEEAAMRHQITMKEIKNGIRVEYQIGEPAIQRLTPRMISVTRMKKLIMEPIETIIEEENYDWNEFDVEFAYEKFLSFYELKDPNKKGLSERAIKEMQKAFPIVKEFPVYVCETNISPNELKILETLVKTCCPAYTYEELDYDNQETGYVNKDQSPPRFTMALEYKITEDGVEVTLPANGISFDETLYQLQTVSVLPYMGAGTNMYKGYTFFPDGSGTIFRYEELTESTKTVVGQMYGPDYAYHEITGQNTQQLTMPVYGAVTNYSEPLYVYTATDKENRTYNDAGYLAIITEGDSMATLTMEVDGPRHPYSTVYATFTPRPSDTYILGDGTSSTAEWTVTSDRRYTGNYTIKYVMLSSEGEYEPSYVGMAEAYRHYLTDNEVLTALKVDEKTGLPLYIESFGSMKGTKRVLSFPVEIDIPLTTFDDIKTMSAELSSAGVKNVNFKLTGFANGGLDATMPYKLSWQEVLGGGDGLTSLLEYAKENGVGIYPEFEFSYVQKDENFDGLSLKDHAIKTIDGRYTRRQVYDSGYQAFQPVGGAAISASVFEYFWNALSEKYASYNVGSISLSTLGSDLNSDFDEDEPFHREDSKEFATDFLKNVHQNNKVMISKGNAYALGYADIITDVALTSSGYISSSNSVPFAGIVLHGSKSFTGTPVNMEGDMKQAILNCIENGASLFFTLSYQNTQELKADEYWSKYYSISYDTWKSDVKKYYTILDDATGDLQTSYITDHGFLTEATRVPTEAEATEDAKLIAEAEKFNAELKENLDARYALAVKRAERLGEDKPSYDAYELEYEEKAKTVDFATKYEVQNGTVVNVAYEGDVQFILNYNSFDITVELDGEEYVVEAMNFARIG